MRFVKLFLCSLLISILVGCFPKEKKDRQEKYSFVRDKLADIQFDNNVAKVHADLSLPSGALLSYFALVFEEKLFENESSLIFAEKIKQSLRIEINIVDADFPTNILYNAKCLPSDMKVGSWNYPAVCLLFSIRAFPLLDASDACKLGHYCIDSNGRGLINGKVIMGQKYKFHMNIISDESVETPTSLWIDSLAPVQSKGVEVGVGLKKSSKAPDKTGQE